MPEDDLVGLCQGRCANFGLSDYDDPIKSNKRTMGMMGVASLPSINCH